MNYDIFFTGVGGQGILTIGKIIADVVLQRGFQSSFYPSKGIAQRGGHVKAQLRLGESISGANIPQGGADLAVAMERSEALKALPYIKPQGDFILFSELWAPTAVALGKADYPALETVCEQIEKTGAILHRIHPQQVPRYQNETAPTNLFVLGAVFNFSKLNNFIDASDIQSYIEKKWGKNAEANVTSFLAGLSIEAVQ